MTWKDLERLEREKKRVIGGMLVTYQEGHYHRGKIKEIVFVKGLPVFSRTGVEFFNPRTNAWEVAFHDSHVLDLATAARILPSPEIQGPIIDPDRLVIIYLIPFCGPGYIYLKGIEVPDLPFGFEVRAALLVDAAA